MALIISAERQARQDALVSHVTLWSFHWKIIGWIATQAKTYQKNGTSAHAMRLAKLAPRVFFLVWADGFEGCPQYLQTKHATTCHDNRGYC